MQFEWVPWNILLTDYILAREGPKQRMVPHLAVVGVLSHPDCPPHVGEARESAAKKQQLGF